MLPCSPLQVCCGTGPDPITVSDTALSRTCSLLPTITAAGLNATPSSLHIDTDSTQLLFLSPPDCPRLRSIGTLTAADIPLTLIKMQTLINMSPAP